MSKIRLGTYIVFCLLITAPEVHAQYSFRNENSSSDQNFYEIQKEMRAYFKENPGLKEEKHWGRLESFLEPRVYPHGDITKYQQKAIAAQERFFSKSQSEMRSPHGVWSFIGPSSSPHGSFGRCIRAKFHPVDTSTFYVLASSGGIWKTSDNANTWTNITEHLPFLFVVDFVFDPNDPNTMYLLTGNDRQRQGTLMRTRGVMKTTDGGNTWQQTAFAFPTGIWSFKLVMHPNNPNVMYAATSSGIHRTNDGWSTATNVLSPPDETRDIEFNPGVPNEMYASTNKQVYRSTVAGAVGTWDLITDSDFGGLDSMRRIELAVAPSNPSCIYLVASNDKAEYVMRSLSNGMDNTWTVMDDTTNLFGGQAWYNMAINVDPLDHNTVYVGAIPLWKSTSGGAGGSWVDKNGTHADHHDVVFNNGYVYDLNDGGVGRSADGGDTWTDLTAGIEIFETYDITGTPQNSSLIYAGGQDTGGNRIDPGGVFIRMNNSGDVTTCLQDPTDVNKSYMAPQGGGLRITDDGWATYETAGPGDGLNFEPEFGNGVWLCPYELDPGNPDFIFTGKDSIWRLDVIAQTAQWLGFPDTGKTRAIAQGTDNRNKLYIIHGVGANGGINLFSTDSALTFSSGGAPWDSLANDFTVNAQMQSLAVNPQNANELFLVYSGTDAGNKVFFSDSCGFVGTWQNISGNLPNVPINDIVFHNSGSSQHPIYIGTDIGVFYRDDSIGDWVYFSNNMPSTPVMDLYINTTSNQILAGTLGRGVWRTNVFSNCPPVILLTGSTDVGGTRYYTAFNTVTSFKQYKNEASTDIHYQAGDHIKMEPPFHIKAPWDLYCQTRWLP